MEPQNTYDQLRTTRLPDVQARTTRNQRPGSSNSGRSASNWDFKFPTIEPAHANSRATYRLQFNEHFRLVDALALVPYLHELGISMSMLAAVQSHAAQRPRV